MTEPDRADFERYVKQNRVFILGAGFSAAAGIPLTEELLARAMKKFSIECPGIYSRVENYAKECAGSTDDNLDLSKISFSEFCTFLEFIELREYGGGERWCENGSREKLALRFYLAKSIAEWTPSISSVPQIYVDFAAQLHERDIVISLNWDGLLEVALEAVGKKHTYNFSDEGAIKLCKLHGSINWRLGEPNQWGKPVNTLDWQSLGFTKGMMTREIYHSPSLLRYSAWHDYAPLGEVDPFLVLPGYGKAFDVRDNAVLWYKPEFAFATTHDVFIIGLGLAHDDFFVRSFFLSNLPHINAFSGIGGRRIFIVNPDKAAASNYDFVLRHGHADLVNESFSQKHLQLMAKRRSDA
ncbi:MAG: hypothetical protein WC100_02995 [Sterolibacterium sp.]